MGLDLTGPGDKPQLSIAVPGCIEDGRLLVFVHIGGLQTQLHQQLGHLRPLSKVEDQYRSNLGTRKDSVGVASGQR